MGRTARGAAWRVVARLDRLGIGCLQHFPDRFIHVGFFGFGHFGFRRLRCVFRDRRQRKPFRLRPSGAGFGGFHTADSEARFDKSNDLGLGYLGKQPFASEEQQERHEI